MRTMITTLLLLGLACQTGFSQNQVYDPINIDFDRVEQEFRDMYPIRSEAHSLDTEIISLKYVTPYYVDYKLENEFVITSTVSKGSYSGNLQWGEYKGFLKDLYDVESRLYFGFLRAPNIRENVSLEVGFVTDIEIETEEEGIWAGLVTPFTNTAIKLDFYAQNDPGAVYKARLEVPIDQLADMIEIVVYIDDNEYSIALDEEAKEIFLDYSFETNR